MTVGWDLKKEERLGTGEGEGAPKRQGRGVGSWV